MNVISVFMLTALIILAREPSFSLPGLLIDREDDAGPDEFDSLPTAPPGCLAQVRTLCERTLIDCRGTASPRLAHPDFAAWIMPEADEGDHD
ncbi:hypothetical protein [Nitratireductor indicus]|uniref:hypothetical protein n=1 Tax=Nitratireductor indicus TaxID=721133 RepID=UPI0028744BE3|nr:hypothetical protein [Nitratireductor indicus]MDS1138599.1 hypothetical protein [Nitratireductor indicus]